MQPPSRVGGRGVLLAGLRRVRYQLDAYARYRAAHEDASHWAAVLADALEHAYQTALESPGSRAALAAHDERRRRSRKVRRPEPEP